MHCFAGLAFFLLALAASEATHLGAKAKGKHQFIPYTAINAQITRKGY